MPTARASDAGVRTMRRWAPWACSLLLALGGASCSRDQSATSEPLTDAQKERAKLRQKLAGTWARRIPTADSLWEGLRIDPDGRFGLLGIHTMYGLYWIVRADTLVLTTSAERYPQPSEVRLVTLFPDADSLFLGADAHYLSGAYERAEDMGWRITGSVTFASELQLGTESALYLELRGAPGESDGSYLASQVMAVDHSRPPLPFHLYYAESDAQGVTEGRLFATLVVEGVPTLALDTGVVVRLGSDVENVELRLDESES